MAGEELWRKCYENILIKNQILIEISRGKMQITQNFPSDIVLKSVLQRTVGRTILMLYI